MPNPTNLEELARQRYGDARAAELVPLAVNLAAGLRIVAEAELDGADEPDFLDRASAE